MRKFKKAVAVLSILSLATLGAGIFAACGEEEYVSDDIVNGSFEYDLGENEIPGWKREDMAFQNLGVTEEMSAELEASGNTYFNGKKAIITNKGTLTSLPFKISGTGKVAFKLGAAKNPEKVYIEFLEYDSGKPLSFLYDGKEAVKATNTEFDGAFVTAQLIRHIADLSAHMGKTVVIRVTDDDAGKNEANYPYANLDDFRLLKEESEVEKYQSERAAALVKYAAPLFEDDTPEAFTIKNGDFEEGLDQWKITGEAFRSFGIANSDATFWEGRYFYAHGEKFFRGDLNEDKTGSMRSTTFTLKEGAPYITMMLGAGKGMNAYAEVRLAEDADGEKKDTVVARIRNTAFKDPERALMLVRTYVKLDEKYEGKKLYINIVDNASREFGFINVDDIRCSLTEAEVTALITEQFRSLDNAPAPSGKYATDPENLRNWYLSCEYPAPANFIRLDKRAEDQVLLASEYSSPVDLTELISAEKQGAKATLAGKPISVKIDEVKKDGVAVTGADFGNFNLNIGVYSVKYSTNADESVALNKNVSASVKLIVTEDIGKVYNGGFETGDLTGWTVVEGTGADIINAVTYWEDNGSMKDHNGVTVNNFLKDGTYFLHTNEGATLTLKSCEFILGGDGYISFKLGGAKNSVSYVALCSAEDDTELIKITNPYFNDPRLPMAMVRRFINASQYLNQRVYVKIVDGATSDFGMVTFDALEVSLTQAEAQAIVDSDKAWAASYRQDVLDHAGSITGANTVNIINTIRNYYKELTLPDAPSED